MHMQLPTFSDVMEHHSVDDDIDVMEHLSVNEDDDDIENGSTSSLNSDTDSNDFLVPEYENSGPGPDDLGAPRWGREDISHLIF